MQPKYKFFYGGIWNPFEDDARVAYTKLTEERKVADPDNAVPLEKMFPKMDSWADYVIAESKSTFWKMERAICQDEEETSKEIEAIWARDQKSGEVDEWLKRADADEAEKAMCNFMQKQHERFAPGDYTINFRLYLSEGGVAQRPNTPEGFSLNPYEE